MARVVLVLLVTGVKQSQRHFEVGLEFDKKNVFEKHKKKCWSKKNFIGHKKFVDPEFFHPKKNLVQQNFESEDIFYPKKLKSKKYLCLEKFRSKKIVQKN